MRLRFGSARANGVPGDQVAQILRRNGVQRFGTRRQAEFVNGQQEFTGLGHAGIDLERIVHVRVVDVAFPAHGGARFFKIHAHDDHQRIGDLVGQRLQATGVVYAGDRVMNRAGAHDDKRARVFVFENIDELCASLGNGRAGLGAQRQLRLDCVRRWHRVEGRDVQVADGLVGAVSHDRVRWS